MKESAINPNHAAAAWLSPAAAVLVFFTRNRELQLFKTALKQEKEETTTATLSPHVHF